MDASLESSSGTSGERELWPDSWAGAAGSLQGCLKID